MRTTRDIEGLLEKASIQTNHQVNQAVRDELLATFGQAMKIQPPVGRPGIRRKIMSSIITKSAIAAAIGIAAFIGISQISGPAVAWGQVVQHIEQAKAFMFSLKATVGEGETQPPVPQVQAQWTIYVSEEHGFRMDITAQGPQAKGTTVSWYVPPQQDKITMVIPGEKKWMQMPYSEEYAKQRKDKDPADYIRRFMAHGYKEIGRKALDGIEVEGIEVQDPPTDGESMENAVGRMWVDVKTVMPVQIEIDGLAKGQHVQWIMDLRWDAAVDPAVFVPDVPADYIRVE
jgi:outer membrane lipoprotein-sorting protein